MEVDVDGVLVVDKPPGPTSHDVVALVRRTIGVTRVGHTGTLDPLATGVLPLVVGRATRLAQFLSAADKEYIADIRMGVVSETYDAEGPLAPTPLGPMTDPARQGAPERLDSVLAEFRGTCWQMPPPYSAKKVGGIAAYKLARRNAPAALKPVRVTVHALEVLAAEGDALRLRVVCSTGFYVRTLAHDIGQRLGCGAYLSALRRTRAGSFTLEQAVPLQDALREGLDIASRLIPLNDLLPDLPAVVLNEGGVRRATHGNSLGPEHIAPAKKGAASFPTKEAAPFSGNLRLVDPSGALLGIGEWQAGGLLHPAIVLV